ncbi:hypothetical protein QFZ79_001350 [Arthrobacter sp. V4I6]|uniref:hypothetical protein n=1 Tax=unclassified Arthrobacter TaxID=235627 RepID=UPI002782D721|nr:MULTISPECIES: hypothetical protein [unclassified Arthrobacter]MDQ0823605.1 hypothetical protein [Arthrobacter sp. V1I7]MDQ0853239.1 hypothetical protein [Arthrobacter sp. V4I6]
MRSSHRAPFVAALATAATLAVTGCGAASGENASPAAAASPPGSASAASAPGTAAPATAGPATAGPAATSPTAAAGEPPSSAPAPNGLVTYTFPDGHVSFKHPADWRVELFDAGGSPFVGTATVYDAAGTRQATVYSGQIADGVTSPVTRTVFESVPVPGLQGQPAPAARYSFYVDRVNDLATYRMHLTAGAPIPGAEMALDGIIRTAHGVLVADVHFIEKPFASDAAAKSWLAGAEGQALKALLLSVSYR